MLEGFGSLRVIEHSLKGRVDALSLPELFDRAAVVACVYRRGRSD